MAEPFLKYGNEYNWHAVYTRLYHEKKVESLFREQGLEVFLPKKIVKRRWSDRIKLIEEPLIRPYIFVFVNRKEYLKVLQVPSVLNYVCFNGKAAIIPEAQINILKTITGSAISCEILNTTCAIADQVIVRSGPLRGCKGEVVRIDDRNHLVINILPNCFSVKIGLENTLVERID